MSTEGRVRMENEESPHIGRIRAFAYMLAVFVKIGEDLVVLAIEIRCQGCTVVSPCYNEKGGVKA